jgi:rhodanese-related sulfurtransferase
MKKYRIISKLFFVFILLWLGSCKDNEVKNSEKSIAYNAPVEVKTKAQILASEVFKNGDIISADLSPKIISAEEVYNLLDKNILVIDTRGGKDFANGHIKNAVSVKMSELMDYAQAKGLPMYKKVILVCYTGQTTSFSAAILQLLGYENIYVLEWGMCGWNKKFSEKWAKNISDKYVKKLVTTPYPKNSPSTLPVIENVKNTGPQILNTRARTILKEGFGGSAVSFRYAEGSAKKGKSYLICYQPESVYKEGHIDNAVLYDQKNSFNLSTDLLTLPTDKTIVIYSDKAYQSTFIMVYLQMLGYKAKTLKYGANSFMNSKSIERGTGFSDSEINNYPFETSEYIEVVGEVQEGGC